MGIKLLSLLCNGYVGNETGYRVWVASCSPGNRFGGFCLVVTCRNGWRRSGFLCAKYYTAIAVSESVNQVRFMMIGYWLNETMVLESIRKVIRGVVLLENSGLLMKCPVEGRYEPDAPRMVGG